jgi:HEAT repeat protein
MMDKYLVAGICMTLVGLPSTGAPQGQEQVPPRTCASVSALLEGAEASKEPGDRQRLLGTLRTTARRECARVFLGVLESQQARDIQEVAVEVLVAIGDENVIVGIENILRQNPDFAARRRLAAVIENIMTPSVAPYLGQMLLQNHDETLRISIPIALGRIGTPESVKQLVNVSTLVEKTDLPNIVRGFALIRNEDALATLRQLFESDVQDPVREGVALALGNYDRPEVLAAVESYLKAEASGRVREALHVSWTRISERKQ